MKKIVIISVTIANLLYAGLWFYQEKEFMKAVQEPDTIKAAEMIRASMTMPWSAPFEVYCLAAFDFHNGRYLDCIIGLTKLKMIYPAFLQSDFLIGESWLYLQNEPRAVAFYLLQANKNPAFEPSFDRIRELCPGMAERIGK